MKWSGRHIKHFKGGYRPDEGEHMTDAGGFSQSLPTGKTLRLFIFLNMLCCCMMRQISFISVSWSSLCLSAKCFHLTLVL